MKSLYVEFEGRAYDFDWPADTPLLDVLLDNGLEVPYVCRESACATCVCTVKSGRTPVPHVVMNRGPEEAEAVVTYTLPADRAVRDDAPAVCP
ncbi:2Fe-2S iron-sulfur cluster-binding protein [Mycobacterium hubeiense]|uniref:2Fe-2S iron-sulfur cluster-binding protein n=1 Tax=Mycobacterium hubeiense TaxID=1867256 RepID=UPI000C7F0DA5|nr:2Fe-2S iron-sulfur cluster-binding protein [Mycobacterium sp. QGD 101]